MQVEEPMKMNKLYTLALLLLSVCATTTSFAYDDHVTVTGTKWTEADVAHAKHQIAMIQTSPEYYYSGAAGATHRVHDVNYYKTVVQQGERYPASVK
jgi:hypothetical protein